MVIAIEPMVNAGKASVKVLADGWTAVTRDKRLSAHFEHTVAVTAGEAWILTSRAPAAHARRDDADPSTGSGSSRAGSRDERDRAGVGPRAE